MLTVWGLLIVIIFMTLIMTKRTTPFTALVLSPVVTILAQTGASYGFTPMQMAVASTTGQAFHLLSPLVGFIYLLLHLTGVDMGAWQRTAAKWSIGTFIIFLIGALTFGGVPI